MLFPKELLAKEVEKTEYSEYSKKFPHKTFAEGNDKTPYQMIFSNKVRYFDLASEKVKKVLFSSRKSIAEKCFSDVKTDLYPNELKIKSCIMENEKEFLEFDSKRELNFLNITHKFNKDLENCPSNDNICKVNAEKEFVWNASKLPYFFSESY